MTFMNQIISGILFCVLIAIAALFLSSYIPIGAVAIAIILGIIIGNLFKPASRFNKGINFSEKHILSLAIALMGVNLNFLVLKELGVKSIFIIVVAMFITISSSLLLAKIFKFDKKFALLLGIGNGICGSSAIAATEQIIGSRKEDVGLSVAIVNFLGTIGIFLLPFIASIILSFTDVNAGLLIGNTLQAVGQVVASGFSISNISGQTATIVKMTRILLLTPVVFILIFVFSNKKKVNGKKGKIKIPLFVIGFVLFSLVPTFKLLPNAYVNAIGKLSHYLLIIAMAGIGLKITFGSILKDGKSALLIGVLIFTIQIVFSSVVIYLFFT